MNPLRPKKNQGFSASLLLGLESIVFYSNIAVNFKRNSMKTIIVIMSLLCTIGISSYGQGHTIKKLGVEDGLMLERVSGGFQDEKGIIWIANGMGFTRYYGDHFDQIKSEIYVFEWSPLRELRKVGLNSYYWPFFKMINGKIYSDQPHPRNYHVHIQPPNDFEMKMFLAPHVDRYGYYWCYSDYYSKDTLAMIRYKAGDTINVSQILDQKGIEFDHTRRLAEPSFNMDLLDWPRILIPTGDSLLWFNSKDGRLHCFNILERNIIDFGEVSNIADVKVDTEGNFWVTKYPTLEIPNPGIFRIEKSKNIIEYKSTGETVVFPTDLGDVYFIDETGLYQINEQSSNFMLNVEGLKAVQQNSKGLLYLESYYNDTTTFFTYQNGKVDQLLKFKGYAIENFIDREDNLWIPSENGLYKCSPSELVVKEVEHELVDGIPFTSYIPLFKMDNGISIHRMDNSYYGKEKGQYKLLFEAEIQPYAKPIQDENDNVYVSSKVSHENSYPIIFEDIKKIDKNLNVVSIVDGDLKEYQGKKGFGFWNMRIWNEQIILMTKLGAFVKDDGPFEFFPLDTARYSFIEMCKTWDVDFHNVTTQLKEEFRTEDQFDGDHAYESLMFDFETKEFVRVSEIPDSVQMRYTYPYKDGWINLNWSSNIINENGKTTVHYNPKSKVGDRKVGIGFAPPLIDSDGIVYYESYDNGLIKFDPSTGEYVQKSVEDGLSAVKIYSLFFNPDSTDIWVSTPFGLHVIEKASIQEDQPLRIKTWYKSDGLRPNWGFSHEFLGDSLLRLSHIDYQLEINLDIKETGSVPPLIYFTEVLLDNSEFDWRAHGASMSSYDLEIPIEIELGHDENSLSFGFQGISHLEKDALHYEYRLVGLEEDWIVTQNKSVSYPELSPGEYTFEVKAVNENGDSDPISVSLTIAKPWYQTTLARIVFVLLILGGFFAFFRVRTAALRRRQIVLENKVEEATVEIKKQKEEAEHQRDLVEEKNQEIMDSITYAKRLQTAILPPQKLVKEWLNDSFIFYKPKDIVAGDFYWMETTKRNGRSVVFYAAADCTGHGVPGAMVSVVCSNALKRAIKEFDISDPGQLLDKVAEIVQESFEQSEHEVKDGMDIAVCAVDLIDRKVWFAGAHNGLYRITSEDTKTPEDLKTLHSGNRKLVEYRADKQPVGAFENMQPFTTVEIQLEPGDCIYLFSDGFADQFGGEKGKKFKYKPFKQLLLDIEDKEMDAQKDILDVEFERWKGSMEQVDDVCIIGLRVNGHMRKLFSKRELEVIQKIKEGRQSKEIADEMEIAKSTVDTYRKRILAKTNLNNAAELIKFCDEHEVL